MMRLLGLSGRLKIYFYLIVAWVVSLVFTFAFPRDIPIVTGIVFLLFFFSGLLLAIFFLAAFIIALVKKKRSYEPAIALSLVLLVCMVTFYKGLHWGAMIHLLPNRSRYETIIAELSSAPNAEERDRICGDDCLIVSGEPLRVAFHYCHWFLNWRDIVHDPTGAVNVDDYPSERRFGVYFRRGERLYGDWYLCVFAD